MPRQAIAAQEHTRKVRHPVVPTHPLAQGQGQQGQQGQQRRRHHQDTRKPKLKRGLLRFFHAKVKVPPFRKTIAPGTDFYTFVNGLWLKQAGMPVYSSSYGVSEEIDSYIQTFLSSEMARCRALAEKGAQPTTREEALRDAIGRLAMSALRESKQKFSIEHLKKGVRSLGCMRDGTDVARTIGSMCRYKIPNLLEISISSRDGGDPTKKGDYCLNLSTGYVGLPDVSYYSAVAPGKSNVLFAYTNLLKTVAKRLDIEDPSQVIPLEARLAAHLSIFQEDGFSGSAEDIDYAELTRRYKDIDWEALLTSYGVAPALQKRIKYHVDYPEWIAFLNDQMKDLPIEQWLSLFTVHTILHALPYLPPPFDDWHHSFYGRMLRGQRKKLPQEVLTLDIVKEKMPTALGHVFVKQYLTPEFKGQATHFVNEIIQSAVTRMKGITWFAPATRRRAAEKLRRLRLGVGYSEPLVSAPPAPPPLQSDNLLANVYLLDAADTDQQIGKLSHGAAEGLWEEPPYTVNAYYYHEINQIIVPAGSFFWPFFNQEHADWIGWNYGGLGAVIGHELTHAFDQEGKQYNERGEMDTWWTAEDEKEYAKKTQGLVRLYDRAKVLGRQVNGTATLDENIADLGGLAIALDALKAALEGRPEEERKKQLRDFFVSYAISWRTKEKPMRRLQRLILDKHAPVELRVNLIVSQFEEWYQAFGVTTADALYIPPEERIRIF